MLPQRQRILALAAALALSLTACGEATDSPGGSPTDDAAPTSTATATTPGDDDSLTTAPQEDGTMRPDPIPVPGQGDAALPTGPVPDSVREQPEVKAAIEAHAERVGVPVEEVTVAGYAQVTWSDGSLGCPQPGMMYTQALVPGQQLILSVDGELASYHAANGKPFSYCASPVAPSQTNPSS